MDCDYCDIEGEEWDFHQYMGGLIKCKDRVRCDERMKTSQKVEYTKLEEEDEKFK